MGKWLLHLPVTLHTRRYCFLGHSVLGEDVSYALAMPMSWGTGYCTYQWPYVHGDIDSWFIPSWERLLARLFTGEPIGNWILHLPVTLRTRRYFFLVYSVLGEGVSYDMTWGKYWGEALKISKCLG